jgi:AAA+ superfamily predicted ATPase
VGKTLTAESISEDLHLPLYTVIPSCPFKVTALTHSKISAGELDLSTGALENQMIETFEMACHWNALLLLDEADVFVADRADNMLRNSHVAMFLRTLEYYEGAMILTTNRVKVIDPAVSSRIHEKVRYESLSVEHRLGIWKSFLGKKHSGCKGFPEKELRKLAERNMNGREVRSSHLNFTQRLIYINTDYSVQIRNIVKVAAELAKYYGKELSLEDIWVGVRKRDVFEEDFHGSGVIQSLNSYL